MIWVAWRVQRNQYAVAIGATGVVALWLFLSGLAPNSGWASSSGHANDLMLYFLPGILGLALGAAAVGGEAQSGTDRLGFTQSISRRHWLMTKTAFSVFVGAVIVGALALIVDWWVRAGYGQGFPMMPKVFAITGIVSIGYAVFAFALGLVLGTALRDAGWAFALGVPIVIVVRLVIDSMRATWSPPVTAVDHTFIVNWPVNSLVMNSAYLPVGRLQPPAGSTWQSVWKTERTWPAMQACTAHAYGQGVILERKFATCAAAAHLQRVVEFIPASRYWPLQLVETGAFLGLAVVLLVAATRWVQRRG